MQHISAQVSAQEIVSIDEFLRLAKHAPILDVRTPAEFAKAHIPSAVNLPLFSNEERARVGTAYKQESREAALLLGLECVGPKMRSFVEDATRIVQDWKNMQEKQANLPNTSNDAAPTVLVHCWRGGMRSASMAWLLRFAGFHAQSLQGGYKAFRRFAGEVFQRTYDVRILGGYTGSRKTQILRALQERGEQVLDLERIAKHKGSAFGALGEEAQPSTEEFENQIAMQLHSFNPAQRVWIEDESRLVGKCVVPEGVWEQMRCAKTVFVDIPFAERVQHLCAVYGEFPQDGLMTAFHDIEQRLGGAATRSALEALAANDVATAAALALRYYDKTYLRGLERRAPETVRHCSLAGLSVEECAEELLKTIMP
ncbi:MAG: tRNA 2-selenouridine(34) synthase MnmH [Candidatus Kapaibacterium sp.]|nr:MAG: tRNA 2-selenouridine(34) synthase MnmH [Candidatus Kapabacteria bacterium]